MSITANLNAERRDTKGKGAARKLRSTGRIPAIVYGVDMDPIRVTVDQKETEYLFGTISVENTIIDLTVDDEKEPVRTLVREVQTHAYRPSILHVDFLRIQQGVAVELTIPVHLEGTPVGVKDSGGVLDHVIHEVPVRCIPSLIPEAFHIDVSTLEIGDSLHVSDIPLEEGVEILVEDARTICSVAAPRLLEVEDEEDEDEDAEVALVGDEDEDEAEETE